MMTQKLSKEIFEKKYMVNGETSAEDVFRGVAYAVADAEESSELKGRWAEHFYREIKIGNLIPAGRILANARPNPKMPYFNNCYTIDIEDSMTGIATALSEYMRILKTGGGVGINFSVIRPKHFRITTGGESSGPLSFAEIFNTASKTISTAGGRRGATMMILDVSHPDIEEFITYKQGDDNKALQQMNISVAVSNAFMNAVVNDEPWELKWEGVTVKTVSAVDLMGKIIANNFYYAEPGIMLKDNAQNINNLYYEPEMEMKVTNP